MCSRRTILFWIFFAMKQLFVKNSQTTLEHLCLVDIREQYKDRPMRRSAGRGWPDDSAAGIVPRAADPPSPAPGVTVCCYRPVLPSAVLPSGVTVWCYRPVPYGQSTDTVPEHRISYHALLLNRKTRHFGNISPQISQFSMAIPLLHAVTCSETPACRVPAPALTRKRLLVGPGCWLTLRTIFMTRGSRCWKARATSSASPPDSQASSAFRRLAVRLMHSAISSRPAGRYHTVHNKNVPYTRNHVLGRRKIICSNYWRL